MRFLTKLLKTPDEEPEEDLDEFDAEENGLLMVQTQSGDKEGIGFAGTPVADALQAGVPPAEGEPADPPPGGEVTPAEAEAEQPFAVGGELPATEESPSGSETPEAVPAEAQIGQDSSDDALSIFRGAAKRINVSPALKEDMQDVSVAELLAAARSLRSLLVKKNVGGAGQRNERAA